jgi:DNA-binding transcriptional LysR family regulator
MDVSKLAKADLNLLVALHVLIEERSVSKAADRLNVTQPAMSKTLNRLRDTFDDPLFARSKRGIQPTPRAEALANELIHVLADIEGLLDAGEFSPQAFRGEIAIAISEYVGFTLLPSLTARLETRAPKLKLRTITRAEQQLDMLADGRLDFAIQLSRNAYPSEFRHFELASSPLAIFVRRDHPLTQQPLTEDNLRLFPQINLYIADRAQTDYVDQSTSQVLGSAKGSVETSHLLTAFEILRSTNYTLVCPAYMARNDGATLDLVTLPLPGDHGQTVAYSLVAHDRTARSPIHQWFWNEVIDAVRGLRVRTVHRG